MFGFGICLGCVFFVGGFFFFMKRTSRWKSPFCPNLFCGTHQPVSSPQPPKLPGRGPPPPGAGRRPRPLPGRLAVEHRPPRGAGAGRSPAGRPAPGPAAPLTFSIGRALPGPPFAPRRGGRKEPRPQRLLLLPLPASDTEPSGGAAATAATGDPW